MTLLVHIAAAHMPMQSPRTLVGKISEHRMLGIGPKPVTNEQMNNVTQVKDIAAANKPASRNMLTSTSITSEIARTGIVASSNCLHTNMHTHAPPIAFISKNL